MNLSTVTRRVLDNPSRAVVLATAVLVGMGVVAALACASWLGLAIVAVLGVQSIVVVLLLWSRRQAAAADEVIRRRLDESDRRVLGDLVRARQAILDALADQRGDDPR